MLALGNRVNAVIVERNKLVARRIARVLGSSGWATQVVDEPAQVGDQLERADLICADAFDGDYIAEQLRARRGLRAMLWTAEPLRRSLRYMSEVPLDHVLARKDFESSPRTWEVAMTARRLFDGSVAPLDAYLEWGYRAAELPVRTTADRDVAVSTIQDFVLALAVPKRVAEMFGELGHELVMNAMYDAPVDARGAVKYALDRKADIVLLDHERPTVCIASDGTRLVLRVRDPFGRLERKHVVEGMVRGLASGGEMDQEHGGAGLGMMVCHNASAALFFDVVRGKSTEVTALFELDQNLRDLRTQAKSLHFWSD